MQRTPLFIATGFIRTGNDPGGLVVASTCAHDDADLAHLQHTLLKFTPVVDRTSLRIWVSVCCEDLGDRGEIAISLERIADVAASQASDRQEPNV